MKKITKAVLAVTTGLFIFSSSAYAASKKVRIFVPTPNPIEAIKKPQKTDKPQVVSVIVHRVYYLPYYSREQRLKLFVGPRYPGFKKQYRGPKYPF